MEESKNIGSGIFVETVLEYSSVLEFLGHSRAFEQVLLDNLLVREDELSIDRVSIPRHLVPAEIIESHNWPTVFDVKNLQAKLISCPTTDCGEAWSFTASYEVNDQKYEMRANEASVISNFYDNNGGSQEHTFDSGTGMRFVRTMAIGLLHEQGHQLSADNTPLITPENPEELRALFKMMGNMKGKYSYNLSSYIKDKTSTKRGLIVDYVESESPFESGLDINYSMIWKVGEEKSTEVSSHQHEVVDSIDTGEYWSLRYTQRGPSESEPNDLPYSLSELETDEHLAPKLVFMPARNNLQYETANTSLMTIIVPYMKPYLYLDEDTPSEIFEAKKSDEFTD